MYDIKLEIQRGPRYICEGSVKGMMEHKWLQRSVWVLPAFWERQDFKFCSPNQEIQDHDSNSNLTSKLWCHMFWIMLMISGLSKNQKFRLQARERCSTRTEQLQLKDMVSNKKILPVQNSWSHLPKWNLRDRIWALQTCRFTWSCRDESGGSRRTNANSALFVDTKVMTVVNCLQLWHKVKSKRKHVLQAMFCWIMESWQRNLFTMSLAPQLPETFHAPELPQTVLVFTYLDFAVRLARQDQNGF